METPGKIFLNRGGREGKVWSWVEGAWVGTRRGHSGPSGVVVMSYFLIWVLATWVCSFSLKIIELYIYNFCTCLPAYFL